MKNKICSWLQCIDGATAIEYGLIAGGISLAIMASLFLFGADLQSLFEIIGAPMNEVAAGVTSSG